MKMRSEPCELENFKSLVRQVIMMWTNIATVMGLEIETNVQNEGNSWTSTVKDPFGNKRAFNIEYHTMTKTVVCKEVPC